MPDTEYRRLIQAAKDKAQFGFLAVVQRAMQEADKDIVEALAKAKSGADQTALSSVRHFLRQEGNVFLRRIDELYRANLERAMQTMYVDLRPGMRKVSLDELSLIDDEVVVHQIEVGRLTERMREANEESIGRLNVMIAQLHGQREAKERENPFRPYLLARALYEAIRTTADDESKSRLLFAHLSNAMAQHLPGFYAAIREVFEASGVHGRFQAQPSRAAHHQRYFGAPNDPQVMPTHLSSRVMPGLQRVLETLQGFSGASGGVVAPAPINGADGQQPASVQDFIRTMFSPPRSFALGGVGDAGKGQGAAGAGTAGPSSANPLVAQLDRFQKMAVKGESVDGAGPADKLRLSTLREKMSLDDASMMERMTIDVVALLFEFILEDEHIPADLREHIGRLQIPMLKAAVLDPSLMSDERHPARQLLNRLSTAALAADPSTTAGKQLTDEIRSAVDRVLADYREDSGVFAEVLTAFEGFLAEHLQQDDSHTTRGIEAIELAERFSMLLTNATSALCDVLMPLNVDKRVSDFIILIWPHVLVHAAWQDRERNVPSDAAHSLYRQFHAVLPELLWSIQEKDAQERPALMRLLPDLVGRMRKALELIQLPEEETKPLLDLMMELHTQVLRAPAKGSSTARHTLDTLRQEFSRLVVHWDRASWGLSEPPQPREAVIEKVLMKLEVSAELNLGVNTVGSSPADREFLAQTYLLGTRVAFRSADGSNVAGQLVWISTHRSLYLFKQDRNGALVLYTPAALLEALRDETIMPVEYAPVFERAVESLLFGVGNLQTPA
ncbi:MAG TPA: DUF1631 family protein [Noviherbaspirillum sp.]